MRTWFIWWSLVLAVPAWGEEMPGLRIIDGDTFVQDGEHIRVLHYDTPEMRGGCEASKRLARIARDRLGAILADGYALSRDGTDRWGRTLAAVSVDGVDVSVLMIDAGLAVPNEGERRIDWCGSP